MRTHVVNLVRKCFREGSGEDLGCRFSGANKDGTRKAAEEQELPTLRKVIPQLPAKEKEVEMLREDLRRVGCAGLLTVP